MEIVGLDHVQLAMPPGGEDVARAFYVDVLGLVELPKPEALAARGGVWFRGGGAHVHLGIEEGFRPARKAHPALLCNDLAACATALKAASAPVEEDHTVDGVRRIYTEDPFGNRVEIIADGDGFSQR